MSKILISYRRQDSADAVGRIYDRLVAEFGREAVFKDVDSIPLGVDFRTYLDEQVGKCTVLLAVIGRDWIIRKRSKGKSMLNDSKDFVRIEIEAALKREIPIIPLLVRGAPMPTDDLLPASITALAYRNGIPVRSDPDFHRDMDRLIESLNPHMGLIGPTAAQRSPGLQAPEHMVLIPQGPFLCGEEKQSINITHDYYIDIYPVTNEQYKRFIEADGYAKREYWSEEGWKWKRGWIKNVKEPKFWRDEKWNQPQHPVVGVTIYEAEAFTKWANKSLPTELGWEKAARGTDGRVYPWGDEFDKSRCNSKESGIGGPTPVWRHANGVSPYGCYDMAGNVEEWTASSAPAILTAGKKDVYGDEDHWITRGGSFVSPHQFVRSYCRDHENGSHGYPFVGFRCVKVPL